MLHLLFLLSLAVPPRAGPQPPEPGSAFVPSAQRESRCWVAPLQVSLQELAMMGQLSGEYVTRRCARRLDGNSDWMPVRGLAVAKTRLGSLELFGERLSYGFDVVVQPGGLGENDTIYTTPALDLPESWQRTMHELSYPALAIAGTAVITAIILEALRIESR